MKHWLLFLAGLLIMAGCAPAAATPAPRLEVTPAAPAASAATPVPVADLKYCKDSVCFMGAHVLNDTEDLLVIFEVVLIDGTLPPPVDILLTNNLILKLSDPQSVELFSGTVAKDEIFCYVGDDAPWSGGRESASCGLTIPLSQLSSQPAVGSTVNVFAPEFGQFLQTVPVEAADL